MAIAVLLVVAAPCALGPAVDPVLRLLGQTAHACACGMEPGTCGCPECARLAHLRLAERPRDAAPAMTKACAQNPAIRMAALPAGVAAAGNVALVPAGRERARVPLPSPLRAGKTLEPPTPPPRRAA